MSTQTPKKTHPAASPEALRAKISQAYARQSREALEERWILECLPMVRHIARKITSYLSRDVEIEDLISAGTVGLVKAARTYDPDKDTQFKTYAYIRIRGAIIDELRGRSFVPAAIHAQIKNIRRAHESFLSVNGRTPDDAELARQAGISQDQLYRTLQEARKRHFLSIHGLSEDQPTMEGLAMTDKSPSPEAQAERKETLQRMTKAIAELPKRDRLLLLLYYERDLTMKEIAEVLELTESRVSQLHAGALFKLSMKLKEEP